MYADQAHGWAGQPGGAAAGARRSCTPTRQRVFNGLAAAVLLALGFVDAPGPDPGPASSVDRGAACSPGPTPAYSPDPDPEAAGAGRRAQRNAVPQYDAAVAPTPRQASHRRRRCSQGLESA